MAMVASAAAVVNVGASRLAVSSPAAKLSRQPTSVCCALSGGNAGNGMRDEQQQHHQSGANSNQKGLAEVAEKCGPLKLSALVVPMLAAALVGSVQPAVHASEWNKYVVPVDNTETLSPDDSVKDLMQRIKEKRAKAKTTPPVFTENNSAEAKTTPLLSTEEKTTPPPSAENKSDAGPPAFSFPFFSPPTMFSPPPAPVTPEIPAVNKAETPAPAAKPVEIPPKEVIAPVGVEAESQKTHGFLPLFLAQFLLLVATVGGGYIFITTPDSKWEELQKTVDGIVEKVTPVAVDSWAKAKPVAIQTQQKVLEFSETAKPYVVKAWEASKPLAAKAVEASKPILKGAQSKVVEFWEQATSNKE